MAPGHSSGSIGRVRWPSSREPRFPPCSARVGSRDCCRTASLVLPVPLPPPPYPWPSRRHATPRPSAIGLPGATPLRSVIAVYRAVLASCFLPLSIGQVSARMPPPSIIGSAATLLSCRLSSFRPRSALTLVSSPLRRPALACCLPFHHSPRCRLIGLRFISFGHIHELRRSCKGHLYLCLLQFPSSHMRWTAAPPTASECTYPPSSRAGLLPTMLSAF